MSTLDAERLHGAGPASWARVRLEGSGLHFVDVFYGPTHNRARSRGMRRSSLQHLLRGAVRPVRETGQIGRRAERRRSDDRSPGRDPVRANTRRVALGLAGQLGRPQMPWRREKNSMSRLEKYGKGKEIKDMFLIDSIGLDALNRPRPFIFIGRDGLIPLRVETLISFVPKYNS